MRVPSEFFSVQVQHAEGAARLRLAGRFDSAALPALDDTISDTRRRDVVMDLDGLTFMDGAAWLSVMAWEHRVHDWGGDFRLVNVPGRIRKIFEVTETEYLLAEVVTT